MTLAFDGCLTGRGLRLSLTRKPSPQAMALCVHSFSGQDNYKRVKRGFPRCLTNRLARRSASTIRGWASILARGASCCMKWTLSMLLSAELLAFRCGFYSLEGTFIWKGTCGTITGLDDQTGIAGRKVDRRARRGTVAEKLRGFRFSFHFNHQRIQMANEDAKLTFGDSR